MVPQPPHSPARSAASTPGRFADFVVINHKRALFPYQDDLIGIVEAIMQRAKSTAVDATIIHGVTVYKDGKFKLVDREETLAEIAARFAEPRTPSEQDLIAFSADMQKICQIILFQLF